MLRKANNDNKSNCHGREYLHEFDPYVPMILFALRLTDSSPPLTQHRIRKKKICVSVGGDCVGKRFVALDIFRDWNNFMVHIISQLIPR